MLEDDFGREVTDVRISLTDRCNFDCVYCHNEGLGDTRGPMDPQGEELHADAVIRFLEVVQAYGVEKVKFTGGEPMLREDLEEIIRRVPGGMEASLTTNGSYLPGRAENLRDAGLERVNISQDALDAEAFTEITRSGAYERVLEGVEAAVEAGLTPVKLNMVVFEQTAPYVEDMVEFVAENEGLRLQLIEFMPELVDKPEWAIDIDRVHEWLEGRADHVETREMHHRSRYLVGGGLVEIVDPVENREFCENCHRVRVTPDGRLKGCLNRTDDLRSMGEMTRQEIRETFEATVRNRVPYYGEYLVETQDGEWVRNERYVEGARPEGPEIAPTPIPADDD
ncbi:MAG: GTP 3',8-cyclase MoaA [Halodesulfurarchaeum sp.]